jgi:ABC-type branched-subunit amino acid transport system substrate-binding protein
MHTSLLRAGSLVAALLVCGPMALAAEVVIGQSAPLSGGNADLGNDIRNGALAYFKKVNDTGGVNGHKIRLVTLDDKNETKGSADNTRKLVENEDVVALFGYASSTLSIPAMPMVKQHHVPFFAPFTGADTIRKQNEFVFTVRATYADEIEKIINFWGNLGSTRVTVLHYDDAVGKQNFETVAKSLEKFGKKPVSVAIKRNADLADASVQEIITSDPQIVVATTLYAPVAQMVKKLKIANKQYMVTSLSFAGASQIAKALGPEAAGITVALTVPTAKSTNVPIVKECTEAWAAFGQSGTMSVTAIEACMAAKVLTEGIRRAGREVNRESLQRSLAGMGRTDVGGFILDFKPGFHHGGKFVDIAVIRQNGDLRN